jgi:hypothetical protein
MSRINFSEMSPSQIAGLVPVWLRIEVNYVNNKYGDQNPQYDALNNNGLLVSTSPAYLEFPNYYGRFLRFFQQDGGDEELLLKASQALGKFVGTGRALTRVLTEADQGVSRSKADEQSFRVVEEVCASITSVTVPEVPQLIEYFDTEIEPLVFETGEQIADGSLGASLRTARKLLLNQAQVFVDFSHASGVIAQPGVASTDENGVLGLWTPPGF